MRWSPWSHSDRRACVCNFAFKFAFEHLFFAINREDSNLIIALDDNTFFCCAFFCSYRYHSKLSSSFFSGFHNTSQNIMNMARFFLLVTFLSSTITNTNIFGCVRMWFVFTCVFAHCAIYFKIQTVYWGRRRKNKLIHFLWPMMTTITIIVINISRTNYIPLMPMLSLSLPMLLLLLLLLSF